MILPISVVILAHQNNQKLQNAVASVKWADEVVIIWNGLYTEEKEARNMLSAVLSEATKLQFHLYTHKIHSFSDLRNLAMRMAKNDWIFFLDSDEVVDKDAAQKVAAILSESKNFAVKIQRKDIFLGKEMKWGEVGNVQIVRLLHREHAQYERDVHEVVNTTSSITDSQIIIYHYAHDSITSFLQKIIKYTQIEATLRQKQNQTISFWQLIVWPTGKFLQNYFFRLGLLDGWRGLTYATLMSIHSFAVRAMLYERIRTYDKEQ
jgi:hypothetical protein